MPSINQLVKELRLLKHLTAPGAFLNAETLQALARLPNLRRLRTKSNDDVKLLPNSFLALESLSIRGSSDLSKEFLEATITSNKLTSLDIRDNLGVQNFPQYAAIVAVFTGGRVLVSESNRPCQPHPPVDAPAASLAPEN